jgi:hypothetical protein
VPFVGRDEGVVFVVYESDFVLCQPYFHTA